jgi:hypothetical protein
MYPESSSTAVLDRPIVPNWDYQVRSIHARHNEVLEEELKKMGREGWELVCVNLPMGNEYHCIFRKPLA